MSSKTVFRTTGIPRIISPSDRAPSGGGLRRYKIRAINVYGSPVKYVLAHNQMQAEAEYLKTTDLAGRLERSRESGAKEIDEPVLSVTALAD